MAKMNKLAKSNKDKWQGKVALIGVSCDKDIKLAKSHIKKTKWIDAIQLFASKESKEIFNISRYPTAVLIHKGKVIYYGHPNRIELEKKIKELLI